MLFYDFATIYRLIWLSHIVFGGDFIPLLANYLLAQARTKIARILLDHVSEQSSQRRRPWQRDMASLGGVSWEVIYTSLESLKNEGVIRVDRHRIIINKELLNQVTGSYPVR